MFYLNQRYGHRGPQQFKNNGNRRGCGHTESIEHVQEDNIRNHYCQKNDHDFGKEKHIGMKDSLTGHFHHSIREGSSNKYTQTGHKKYNPTRSSF